MAFHLVKTFEPHFSYQNCNVPEAPSHLFGRNILLNADNQSGASPKIYRFGPFELDIDQKILKRGEILVALPPKAVETLIVLIEHSGKVVDKKALFQLIWPDSFVAESSLMKNISLLRKVLDENSTGESAIQTVSKRGYRFVLDLDSRNQAEQHNRRLWLFPALAMFLLALMIPILLRNRSTAALTSADREYLIGRYLWGKLNRQEMEKARERFERAVELDPTSALAHAGLADTYVMMTTLGLGRHDANLPRARAAAEKAIALNGHLAPPHVSLGYVRVLADFNWREGEKEFRRAIALDPRLASAHHGYACLLAHCGRLDEARVEIRRAQAIDPVSPLIGVAAARIEYYDRRYRQATEILKEVLEREPSFSQAHYYLAMSLGELGQPEEALHHLHQARVHSSLTATEEAWLKSLTGDRQESQTLLAERQNLVASGRAGSDILLLPAVDSRDFDLAFSSLEQMIRARRIELVSLRVNPRFEPLRSDPRFTALVRQLWPDQ